jgi:hypothetical protein
MTPNNNHGYIKFDKRRTDDFNSSGKMMIKKSIDPVQVPVITPPDTIMIGAD